MKIKDLIKFSGYKENKNLEIDFYIDGEKLGEENITFGVKYKNDNETPEKFVILLSKEPIEDGVELELEDD